MNPNLVETMPVESGGDDAIAQLRRRSLKFFSNYFAVVPGRSQHHRRQIPASASHPSVGVVEESHQRCRPATAGDVLLLQEPDLKSKREGQAREMWERESLAVLVEVK
ncbi:hypothetical protein QQ045_019478 [Rhodiola kirilowii]